MTKNKMQLHFWLFFIIVAIENMAANFAHPITPTLIKSLQLGDSAFGILYAGMAFTNFLFSPFWASMVPKIGSKKVLGICCVGYGFGQLGFALSKTLPIILCARLVSGFFVGGIMVSFLTYIIQQASDEKRGGYLTAVATLSSIFSAFGYLIGGMVGVYSIFVTFMIQMLTLCICGIGALILLKEDTNLKKEKITLKECNPFLAFKGVKNIHSSILVFLLINVFISSFAATAYDQNFNYFIMDQFHFPSSYNGMIKAIVGFVSLVVNITIARKILRRKKGIPSLVYIFLLSAISMLSMYAIRDVNLFFVMNILFFACNALFLPLLQDGCASHSDADHRNEIMGFYNAIKSLGMIVGALVAGACYGIEAGLPFLIASILFIFATGIMVKAKKM